VAWWPAAPRFEIAELVVLVFLIEVSAFGLAEKVAQREVDGLAPAGQAVFTDHRLDQVVVDLDRDVLQHEPTIPSAFKPDWEDFRQSSPGWGGFWTSHSLVNVSEDRLYFRQLLAGRDFAAGDVFAMQMRNFAYLIGDRETGDCVVVDPAYAAGDLVDAIEADGMRLSGVLVTHHHPDHVGGSMMGFQLAGLAELLERTAVPVHVNTHEALWVSRVTGIGLGDLTTHEHRDKISIGEIEIELLHTPGHTPGSQCFLLDGRLVAGDTLFLEGCGRTDFPGGDSDEMYRSLHQLAQLPGDPTVFPGHWYSADPSASLSEVKRSNYVYRAANLDQWRMLMGG
jgi:glyoxylase-like metal-dependent hydrolase (beta-lactamase superfamily II)